MVTGEGEDARSSVSLYRLPLERWPVDSQNHSTMKKVRFQAKNRSKIGCESICMKITDCPPIQAGSD